MKHRHFLLVIFIIVIFSIVYYTSVYDDPAEELALKINAIDTYISDNIIDIGEKINVPMYYINLDRSEDRRESIEEQLEGTSVKATRISAVDGKKIDLGKKTYITLDGKVVKYSTGDVKKKFSKSELGCTFSHLHAIDVAYKNGDKLALIVEDDIFLGLAATWKENLTDIIATMPADWGAIQLFTSLEYKSIRECKKHVVWNDYYGCVAYVVDRKFMKIVSEFLKEPKLEGEDKIVSDFFIYNYAQKNGYGVYTTYPMFVPDNRFLQSSIHDKHTVRHIKQSNVICSRYVKTVNEQGRALEFSKKFMKCFLERLYDSPIVYNGHNPDLYVNSHFGKVEKCLNPFITWSGESHKVKNDKKSLLNLLSFNSNEENDVWVPYILISLSKPKVEKIMEKKFSKMNQRENFLAYINSNCVKKREDLFSEILKLRPEARALGKCSNNTKIDDSEEDHTRYHKNGEIYESYRFVIAMENLDKDGYITEKIINAYLGGAIPIYSGGKNTADKFFKKGTYIDVNDFDTLKECAKFVCELDKDMERLQQIQDTNIFRDDKVPDMFKWYERDNLFMNQLVNIARDKIQLR
jgi:GR25 family glycosyltransferase involved in LPS biosynthesis